MDGDGISDLCITAPYAVYIFRNECGRAVEKCTEIGCGVDFTLY